MIYGLLYPHFRAMQHHDKELFPAIWIDVKEGSAATKKSKKYKPIAKVQLKKVTKLSVNLMSKMLEEGVVNMYLTWPLLWSEVLSCNFQTFASSLCTIFAIVWTMNIPVLRLILPSFHFSLSNLHLRVALAKGAMQRWSLSTTPLWPLTIQPTASTGGRKVKAEEGHRLRGEIFLLVNQGSLLFPKK